MNIPLPTAILLALALGACTAPTTWQRAGVDADQVAFDLQTCRGQARARMSTHQYFASERAAADARAADAAGRGDGYGAVGERWAEVDARRDSGALVADCMAGKGYRRAPTPAPGQEA